MLRQPVAATDGSTDGGLGLMCGNSAHNRLAVHPAALGGENTVFSSNIEMDPH
jgi:hypothetical protein